MWKNIFDDFTLKFIVLAIPDLELSLRSRVKYFGIILVGKILFRIRYFACIIDIISV